MALHPLENINLLGKSNEEKLRIVRIYHNVTQRELGAELGYSTGNYIGHVESGKRGCSDEFYQRCLTAIQKLKR